MGSARNQTMNHKVIESLPGESLKLESHFILMVSPTDNDLLRYICPLQAIFALNAHIWGVTRGKGTLLAETPVLVYG